MNRWLRYGISLLLLLGIIGTVWGGRALAASRTPVSISSVSTQEEEGITLYTVQRGDTLYSIARRFGTSTGTLVRLNNLSNPNRIRVGQVLRIPASAPTPTPTPTPSSDQVWSDPSVAIEVFSPVADVLYHSPMEIIGYSRTFEGNVRVRLRNSSGETIADRNALGGSVDGYAFFHTTLRFVIDDEQAGTLEVFEESAADGSEINKVTIPLTLLPGQRVIDLERPAVGETRCSPLSVAGYSNTFEANVLVSLASRDGAEIQATPTTGGNLGFYREFNTIFTHPVTTPQPLLVSAYTDDARGFGNIDHTRVPIALHPTGSNVCR